jgi:hypothetical protein
MTARFVAIGYALMIAAIATSPCPTTHWWGPAIARSTHLTNGYSTAMALPQLAGSTIQSESRAVSSPRRDHRVASAANDHTVDKRERRWGLGIRVDPITCHGRITTR